MTVGQRDGAPAPAPEAAAASIRAFVACPLPGATKRAAAALQRRLAEAALPLRPTPDNDLHVTALFLGEVEYDRVLGLWQETVVSLTPLRAPRQRATRVLCLPAGPRPRVVCLALEGDQGLATVHRRLADAAIRAGFRVDRRPFLAHATVARVRQPAPDGLERAIRRIGGADLLDGLESEAYDRVVLYRSDLGSGGPRYTELASVTLEGPRA